jgi:2,5-diketo-D-gluconate reductase A
MTLNWLQIGGRGIDTAFEYDNQAEVGAAINASGVARSSIFVTSKIVPSPCTQAAALDAVKVDLQQLGLQQMDLVLHHDPCDSDAENVVSGLAWPSRAHLLGDLFEVDGRDPAAPTHRPRLHVRSLTLVVLWQAVWAGLVQAKQLGLARAIGVSHYTQQQLEAIMASAPHSPPAVNQCQLSVGSHDDATIAFCKAKGITYESFSPLRSVNLADPTLVDIAKVHGVSSAQVALRWVTQLGCPLATSPGLNPEYANEDLGIGGFTLTSDEMSTISAM